MPSRPKSSEILASIPNEVVVRRSLLGQEIIEIQKTGSRLAFIGEETLRYSEMPLEAASVWNFAHSYAPKVLTPQGRELVIPTDNIQVSQILQSSKRERMQYRENAATVFGAIDGDHTLKLAQDWQIDKQFWQWCGIGENFFDPNPFVSLDTMATNIFTDIHREAAEYPEHIKIRIMFLYRLLETYWDQFRLLNAEVIAHKKDGIERLISNSYWQTEADDAPFTSSVKMIRTLQSAISLTSNLIYTVNQESNKLQWKHTKLEHPLLLLLHTLQAAQQEKILWWFGLRHGDLHPMNITSQLQTERHENDPYQSTLLTRLIDFDEAGVTVEKIIRNKELTQYIDQSQVKILIENTSTPVSQKLILLHYYPRSQWTEEMHNLVKANNNHPMVRTLNKLYSLQNNQEDHTLVQEPK